MTARLQAFYGGNPREWLLMPLWLLRAYIEHLPMLEGELSMRHASEVAVGSGTLKPADARSTVSQWRRASRRRGDVIRPESEEERQQMLLDLGIQSG